MILRLSFALGRTPREFLASVTSREFSEYIAADRLGLVPDNRRPLAEEEGGAEPEDMLALYECRKAAYER